MRLRDVLRLELPENSAQVAVCEERVLLDVSDQGVLGVHHHVVILLDQAGGLQLHYLLCVPAFHASPEHPGHVVEPYSVRRRSSISDRIDVAHVVTGGMLREPDKVHSADEQIWIVLREGRGKQFHLAQVALVEQDHHRRRRWVRRRALRATPGADGVQYRAIVSVHHSNASVVGVRAHLEVGLVHCVAPLWDPSICDSWDVDTRTVVRGADAASGGLARALIGNGHHPRFLARAREDHRLCHAPAL
mmetsp:Transcript_50957/g.135784  ORF Transcript_50957/g.135784 Transcript_50957/m.135784 type:complete len:247 (-) Transcript_50957:319-1059(-)